LDFTLWLSRKQRKSKNQLAPFRLNQAKSLTRNSIFADVIPDQVTSAHFQTNALLFFWHCSLDVFWFRLDRIHWIKSMNERLVQPNGLWRLRCHSCIFRCFHVLTGQKQGIAARTSYSRSAVGAVQTAIGVIVVDLKMNQEKAWVELQASVEFLVRHS
jgi:hypothetical protein